MLLNVTNTPFFTSVKVVLKFVKQRLYCVTSTSEEIHKTYYTHRNFKTTFTLVKKGVLVTLSNI